ncbi:MAG TPA: DUF3243 domain-containing protein [Candidatus Avamphibacillus intestinigallinarum]|nr:DUF3243 domain-containing protein [Candidatus Avamphibacillus intestinigallinarum]
MSMFNNFESWKDFLQDRLEQAKNAGMSNEKINHIAGEVGDYLANHVDPKNSEQAVLKDLWNVASEEEQEALASSMVKLVKEK